MMLKKVNYIQIAIIFLLCINIQSTYAQQPQTMLQKENLRGRVKYVLVTNENNQYIKVWYDVTGKKTKKEVKFDDDAIVSDYIYGEDGRLNSEFVHFKNNPTEKIEVVSLSFDDGTPKYDERGNCILQRYRDDKYIKRVYNDKNQLIEAFTNSLERMNVWMTDSLGRAYEETRWIETTKRNHLFFEYNERGNISIVRLKTINGYTILNTVGEITYKGYDSAGNWLERLIPEDYDIDSPLSVYSKYEEINDTYLGGYYIKRIIKYY